ncbi:hypothetical protein [Burkholderia multivorans]|uniref:hypothetical protein n=1 Tax=Burkholderia multivorans TaxID=87883 RepID=UPI002862E713|nr:hypothetical protein [Burkholderia multivorans]MDR9095492.1 hypothetical protein [Burkholderia multivorans]MDR9119271.1 hypothetical protein [Burkholderia multivorans]MDR9158936.1 hypothetical protein [Burkholderia multivorans]MDR9166332.1 hypothetical protein [Burkholderia multivorans]MDR9252948.1 hypothetical protein [Burkholderia multivorans]
MSWNIGMPPKNMLVALVVRKWHANIGDGLRMSLIAADPGDHVLAFGRISGKDPQVEPAQTVRMGQLVEDEDGLVVLDEDGDQADFEVDAILAWAHVPSFAMDPAAAQETDLLLRRISSPA